MRLATMELRRFQPADVEPLWRLFYETVHRVNRRDYSPAQVQAWAPPAPDMARWQQRLAELQPWVAVEAGEIVGYADLQPSGYIDHFYGRWDRQRRGVGRLLMDHLHQQAIAQGLPRLWARVSLTAKPFFLRYGFVVITENLVEVRGVTMANFTMEKWLVPPPVVSREEGAPGGAQA